MEQLINDMNASELMENTLLQRFSDVEAMQLMCKRLLDISESVNNLYGCAFANLYLLDYALTQGKYDDCRFYLQRTQPMCEENGFDDLLLTMHNIAGMYYQDILDEQSALQHYSRGLELAKAKNNPVMEGKLLNNIGICFSRRNDDAGASDYFGRAFEAIEPHLDNLASDDLGNAVSFLCNLAEAYRGIHRAEDAEKALLRAEAFHMEEAFWKICLQHARCGNYAMCGDSTRSIALAKQLLEDGLEQNDNAYLKTSAAMEVCGYMLEVGCQELALRYLHLLESCCGPDNLGDCYNCQVLRVRYYESFGTPEELRLAYRRFYEVSVKMQDTNHAMRVQAELSKIELTRALLDRQAMYKKNRELENSSHMDELTWLYNRRYLSKLFSKVILDKHTVTIGCIMIDVDYFKQYNDFYGHFKGDAALRCVATLLREHAGDGVYPGRYGGDEFLVLCINRSVEQIDAYIHTLQSELSAQRMPHEKSLCNDCLTLSIGYSNGSVTDGNSSERLLEQADRALYLAKSKGRNCCIRAGSAEASCDEHYTEQQQKNAP